MLLIFAQDKTARLKYTCRLVFDELLGVDFSIITDEEQFKLGKQAKLNYSSIQMEDGIQIIPNGLLEETGIEDKTVVKGKAWYGLPTLQFSADADFDPLAMTFYLVSRYEEYGSFEPDDHNRFPAEASCLVQHDLISKPIVNQWCLRLLDRLKDLYPELESSPRTYDFRSTIDIDQAWKYKHKGFLRTAGGILRDIRNKDLNELRERWSVLTGNRPDPFYNFDWQEKLHEEVNAIVTYFIHVGQHGTFDKSTSTAKKPFRRLIQSLDENHLIGIHPSYQSNHEFQLIEDEKKKLEDILDHQIGVSRQHYLMHEMPVTFRNLIKVGIREDHTLGYTTHSGFRAGIAAPFKFFDLRENATTSLTLIPFCSMDITPMHYMRLTPSQAIEHIKDLIWEVQNVGGLFVSLWHNESLSNDGRWAGWRIVYEKMMQLAI